jgi:uncharacterized protein YaaN involved in tellurite resistance
MEEVQQRLEDSTLVMTRLISDMQTTMADVREATGLHTRLLVEHEQRIAEHEQRMAELDRKLDQIAELILRGHGGNGHA